MSDVQHPLVVVNDVTDSISSPPVEQKRRVARRRDATPPRSPFKQALIFAFAGFLVCFAAVKVWALFQPKEPQIVYAQRYSKEFKYRPAASPIITETLKDGRIRLRGTYPTPTPVNNEVAVKTNKGKKKRRSKSSRTKKPKRTD
ncbi:hypothetical protein ONZ45_g17572 [Pleurotus djamor]|nr:hypothetical protein ONZ45_g17572 [Pleurotus djamor]